MSGVKDRLHLWALHVFGVLPRPARSRIVRILAPTFTVGTAVVIQNHKGQVILVRQPYTQGWTLPGGLVARQETPAEAAAREIHEELGLELAFSDHPIAVRTPWRRHFNFLFLAGIGHVDPDSMKGRTPEIADVGWFALDDLPELAEYTPEFLDAVGLDVETSVSLG